MIKVWIKNIALYIKLLFITKKEELIPQKKDTISSSSSDMLTTAKMLDNISDGIHKEDKMFSRVNNLVEEFTGYPPIVYESDMITIRKQSQYEYEGNDKCEEPDELLMDDVDLLGGKDIPSFFNTLATTNRANYLTDKEAFEERWEDIKRQARQERPETELDEETKYIDGIIKE